MVGLIPDQLWQLTEREFYNMARGYFETVEDRAEMQKILTREMWEMTRWEAWAMINAWLGKNDKIPDPKQLIQFSWDQKKNKTKKLSPEEFRKQITDKLGETL